MSKLSDSNPLIINVWKGDAVSIVVLKLSKGCGKTGRLMVGGRVVKNCSWP